MNDKKSSRRLVGIAGALILFALLARLSARAQTAQNPAGIWRGTVTGKPGTVHLFFTIEKKDAGATDRPSARIRKNRGDVLANGLEDHRRLDLGSSGIFQRLMEKRNRSDNDSSEKNHP